MTTALTIVRARRAPATDPDLARRSQRRGRPAGTGRSQVHPPRGRHDRDDRDPGRPPGRPRDRRPTPLRLPVGLLRHRGARLLSRSRPSPAPPVQGPDTFVPGCRHLHARGEDPRRPPTHRQDAADHTRSSSGLARGRGTGLRRQEDRPARTRRPTASDPHLGLRTDHAGRPRRHRPPDDRLEPALPRLDRRTTSCSPTVSSSRPSRPARPVPSTAGSGATGSGRRRSASSAPASPRCTQSYLPTSGTGRCSVTTADRADRRCGEAATHEARYPVRFHARTG